MKTSSTTRAAMLVAMSATVAFAQLVSIPADQVDSKKYSGVRPAASKKPVKSTMTPCSK